MPTRREQHTLSARNAFKLTAFDDRLNEKTSIGIPTSEATYQNIYNSITNNQRYTLTISTLKFTLY